MSKSPAFQLYASDFYMDISGWDNDEVGIYLRLLLHQWVNGFIPPDLKTLSKISQEKVQKFTKKWKKIEQKFIKNNEGNFINLRLENERIKQLEHREKLAESGRLGGLKSQEVQHKKQSESSSEALSNPSSKKQALQSSSSSSYLKPKRIYSEFFLNFWEVYPIKVGKDQAWKAWEKRTDLPDITIICDVIKKQKEWRAQSNGEFRPEWKHPATWLNAKGWEDETTLTEKEDKYADIFRKK